MQCNNFEQSRVVVLPFVDLDPGNLSTLYTALYFAQNECNMRRIQFIQVTFDQPLYNKAVEIVESSHLLKDKIFIRLGGFHLLMSYMGSIGYIMNGSGLEVLWGQVYAGNTVVHMMAGHAYSRALRAHFLTSPALVSFFTSNGEFDIDLDFVEKIHKELLKNEAHFIELDKNLQLQDVVKNVDEIMSRNEDNFRTIKLWKTYFKMAKVLLSFFIFRTCWGLGSSKILFKIDDSNVPCCWSFSLCKVYTVNATTNGHIERSYTRDRVQAIHRKWFFHHSQKEYLFQR